MIVVTNLNDSGAGSFRAAVLAAAPGEQITFSVTGTITMVNGKYLINQSLIITGPGSSLLTLDAGAATRIFDVTVGIVSISGLKIINGNDPNSGGGIRNQATLTLSDIVVQSCFTAAGDGGGIYNTSTITATDVSVSGCIANTGDGGGIWNHGTITASNLSVSGCSGSTDGGGIWNDGTFTHNGGSIVGCDAGNNGGGLHCSDFGCTHTATEVNFENNTCATTGAGIYNNFGTITLTRCAVIRNNGGPGITTDSGTFNINNSTISSNTGAGVLNILSTVRPRNSTIVLNLYGVAQDPGSETDFFDTILSGNSINDFDGDTADTFSFGHNIFGVQTNPISPGAGDQTVLTFAALVMGPLQNNGGPTETHALLSGSPAIDAGDNAGAPSTDQRGTGFPRTINSTIDIGAYESDLIPIPPEPPTPVTPPGPTPVPGPAPIFPTANTSSTARVCLNPPSPCPRPEEPINNTSSEAPDGVDYFSGMVFISDWDPPIGQPWVNAEACGVTCTAPSQAEADACARRLAASCQNTRNPVIPPDTEFPDGGGGEVLPPIPPDVPNNPPPLFLSHAATATDSCPDGTQFSYTVPAGSYTGATQTEADQKAIAKAQQEIVRLKWCITPISGLFCRQQPVSGTFFVQGFNPQSPIQNYPMVLISGAYPTGVSFAQFTPGVWTATGTPTEDGVYTFTVRITNWDGSTRDTTMSMEVWGITTTLNNLTSGTPASYQMAASGTQTADTYSVSSGSLPPGMTLSSSGLFSGTPILTGSYLFTIKCTRSNSSGSGQCSSQYSLEVGGESAKPACLGESNYFADTTVSNPFPPQTFGSASPTPPGGPCPSLHCSGSCGRTTGTVVNNASGVIFPQICCDIAPVGNWFMRVDFSGTTTGNSNDTLTFRWDMGDLGSDQISFDGVASPTHSVDIPITAPGCWGARAECSVSGLPSGSRLVTFDIQITFHQ